MWHALGQPLLRATWCCCHGDKQTASHNTTQLCSLWRFVAAQCMALICAITCTQFQVVACCADSLQVVHTEVFPLVLEWLDKHDCLPSDMAVMTTAGASCVSTPHMSEGNVKDARLVPENEGRSKHGPGEVDAQDAAGDVLPGLTGEGVTSDSAAHDEHGRQQAASTSTSLPLLSQLRTGVRSRL